MRTGVKTRFLSLLLCVCMVLPTLAACGDKKDTPPPSEELEIYYTSVMVEYKSQGEYSGTLTLADEIDDSFVEVSKEKFTISAFSNDGEEESGVQIIDFSVTKTDDRNLAVTFKSPFDYDDNISYILMSDTAVTADEKKIAAVVYTYVPQPELNIDYKGLYKGTDEAIITATLTEDWKFAENMTSDMLSFPSGFDVSVDVTRESDTKAIFVITNIPEDYTGVAISATLSAGAINSEFSTDTELYLDFLQPDVEINPSSVSFDANTNIFTVGKVTLSEGFTGVQDGISVLSNLYSVAEQSYDNKNNAYSFKLKIDDNLGADTDVNELLSSIIVDAILKTETEEIEYAFSPYNATAGVKGNVITDMENGKVYIELMPYNATFKEGISADDVTVSGADGLTNFVCSSVDTEKIVYTADYSSQLRRGAVLSFEMAGSVLNAGLGLDAYSFMILVPPYSDSKDIDWAALGKSAAAGFAGKIGGSIAGLVLPHVYDYLGVDTSNPELNAIQNSISKLSSSLSTLSNDIANLEILVEVSQYKDTLDVFQTLEDSLIYASVKLLSHKDVINYVKALTDHDDTPAIKSGIEKFCDYLTELYGGVRNAMYEWDSLNVYLHPVDVYNGLCDATDYSGESLSLFKEYVKRDFFLKKLPISDGDVDGEDGFDMDPTDPTYPFVGYQPMNIFRLYEIVLGAEKYYGSPDSILEVEKGPKKPEPIAPKPVSAEILKGFTDQVGKLNANDAYIKDVIKYGNRILSNASGTSGGIIDLYFQVVDNSYNFESQTIDAKRAFVTKVQNVYLTNAAIALQYCDVTGDKGSANSIRTNMPTVMNAIDGAFKQIDDMDARAAKGNDKLLVSGQVVSKTMNTKGASKGRRNSTDIKKEITSGFESVSDKTYQTMMQRAKKRNLSLADDLKAQGFANVYEDEGGRYLYLTGNAKYFYTVTKLDWFLNALKLWGYGDSNPQGEYRVTTVTQDGAGTPTVTKDDVLQVDFVYEPSTWEILFSDGKTVFFVVPSYNQLIGFAPGN